MKRIHSLLCSVWLLITPAIAAATEPLMDFILAAQSNRAAQAVVELAGENENKGQDTPARPRLDPAQTAAGHQTNSIEGWTVLVHERLLAEDKAGTAKALELLRAQLQEIVRVVPPAAVAKLREVTLCGIL